MLFLLFLSYLASVVISCGIGDWERKWLCIGRAFRGLSLSLINALCGVWDMVTLLLLRPAELHVPSKCYKRKGCTLEGHVVFHCPLLTSFEDECFLWCAGCPFSFFLSFFLFL